MFQWSDLIDTKMTLNLKKLGAFYETGQCTYCTYNTCFGARSHTFLSLPDVL